MSVASSSEVSHMTHRERALITLRGGQADYVPTFELAFHETERDFDGRVFYGVQGGPDRAGASRIEMLRHNARLMLDIARRFEHSIILVAPVDWPQFDQSVDMIKMIRDAGGDDLCLLSPGDPTFKIPPDPTEFSLRIYDDPEGLEAEAQRRVDELLPVYDAVMAAGADGVVMTSDYAFNSGTFLSPEQFRRFVAPYLTRAVREVHDRGGVVIKHTDGNLMGVLDQIVAAGPDALHSIDPMAGMDIRQVKQDWGDRVCLIGNVHCAWLQTGTPQQIRQSAEYCLEHAKPGGGYIFSTSNCVFRGMPIQSYDLIHSIWRERRDYQPQAQASGETEWAKPPDKR